MKRILKLLARLYPSAWRNRYGNEYEALLEDATPRPQDAFNVLWGALKMQLTSRSFVRIVLPFAIAGAILATAISFAVQPRYGSQALITVTESAPTPNGGLDQVLLGLRSNVLNRDFLASLIQKYNLYPGERSTMPLDKALDKMQHDIWVKPAQISPARAAGGNTTGFFVYFVYSDPHLAQMVEEDLTSRFIQENLLQKINAASAGGPNETGLILRVEDAPNLPNSPIFPRRGVFAFGGLLGGLLCGLILATFFRNTPSPAQ